MMKLFMEQTRPATEQTIFPTASDFAANPLRRDKIKKPPSGANTEGRPNDRAGAL